VSLTPAWRARVVLAGTFAASVLFAVMPGPVWAEPFRPDWAGLVLIYWCIATPHRVGVGTGWLLGLLLDVLYGSLLGLHALGMALMAFITVKSHLRLRMFPRWQQSAAVLILLLIDQLIVLWIRGATGRAPESFSFWTPVVVGALIWPWLFVILRDLRRRGNID
jgi:rod shape-determining protein MreD